MPIYSYNRYESTGQSEFSITFDYLASTHIEVYVDGVKQTTGFTINTSTDKVVFDSATSSGAIILIQRVTPKTKSDFQTEVADFSDGSVLTEEDLDTATLGLLYISQEAEDSASSDALGLDQIDQNWTAENKRIKSVATPTSANDAVTKTYVDGLSLYDSPTVPELYGPFTATASQTAFTLDPAPASTDANSFFVDIDGVIQKPTDDFTVSGGTLTLTTGASEGQKVTVRNIGVSRDILTDNPSVTGNLSVGGTLGATGATTLSSTLGVTGAATLSSTLGVTGASTLTGGVAGDLNILTGALQMAGEDTLTIRQVVVGTTSNTGDYTRSNESVIYTHGRSVTIEPKSPDSVILLFARFRADAETETPYTDNRSIGINAWFYEDDTAASGDAVNGTKIVNSFYRQGVTFTASTNYVNVFDQTHTMWYLVPASDHTTAQVKYSIGFSAYSNQGELQIYPDDYGSSMIAIEIG